MERDRQVELMRQADKAQTEEIELREKRLELEDIERKGAEKEQAEERGLTGELYQMIGRAQMGQVIKDFANVSSLVFLKQVKDSKIYKEIPEIRTWENCCRLAGFSRAKVDQDILNIQTFGEEFFEKLSNLGLGYREFRKLRQIPQDVRRDLIDGKLVDFTDKEEVKSIIEDLVVAKHKAEEEKKEQIEKKDKQVESGRKQLNDMEDKNRKLQADLEEAQKIKLPATEEDQLKRLLDIKREYFFIYSKMVYFAERFSKLSPRVQAEIVTLYNYFAKIGIEEMHGLWKQPELETYDFDETSLVFDIPGMIKLPIGHWDDRG